MLSHILSDHLENSINAQVKGKLEPVQGKTCALTEAGIVCQISKA